MPANETELKALSSQLHKLGAELQAQVAGWDADEESEAAFTPLKTDTEQQIDPKVKDIVTQLRKHEAEKEIFEKRMEQYKTLLAAYREALGK